MLITVLVMAAAVSVEPFRIGMAVLMMTRPRPVLQLLAFLAGGFAMGMTVGLVVLFLLRRVLLGSSYFTVPKVQLLIGVLALLVAAALAVDVPRRLGSRPAAMARPAQRLLNGDSLSVAGLAGLGIALPSVAAAATQVGALLLFNVVAFALVEIPLLAYLVAPARTAASMTALHNWIRSRRRPQVAVLLAAAGCVFLTVGVTGL